MPPKKVAGKHIKEPQVKAEVIWLPKDFADEIKTPVKGWDDIQDFKKTCEVICALQKAQEEIGDQPLRISIGEINTLQDLLRENGLAIQQVKPTWMVGVDPAKPDSQELIGQVVYNGTSVEPYTLKFNNGSEISSEISSEKVEKKSYMNSDEIIKMVVANLPKNANLIGLNVDSNIGSEPSIMRNKITIEIEHY